MHFHNVAVKLPLVRTELDKEVCVVMARRDVDHALAFARNLGAVYGHFRKDILSHQLHMHAHRNCV